MFSEKCNGKIFVDFIGRFENISNDWKIVADKIGIKKELPIKNESPHENYTYYYDEWCIQKVVDIYKRDIELFNYKFGE
jgi:hypothetical protein